MLDHRSIHRHLILIALSLVLTALPASAEPPCVPGLDLAQRFTGGTSGSLPFEALYQLDEDLLIDRGELRADLVLELGKTALTGLSTSRPVLCVDVVLEVDGELRSGPSERLDAQVGDGEGWRYGTRAPLPEGTAEIFLILQEPATGRWGATAAVDAEGSLPGNVRAEGSWQQALGTTATATGPRTASRQRAREVLVRLVPPRREIVSGATRFDALVASDAVHRVDFVLDGTTVAERRRVPLLDRPFSARIPLDNPPREQVLEAIAFDRDGRELDRDTLQLNRPDRPFRVRITGIEGDPSAGSVELRAQVGVPSGAELDRVELYRNEALLATFNEREILTRVSTANAGPEDYLRVAAFLADGSSIDDVVFLTNPVAGEEVEVNLVELHTVVTDRQGQPVDNLSADDFRIVFDGDAQAPQSFAYADDVPLLLGLVVDTSGSMQLLMHDTRRAAAKFLGTTVLPQDRAFLVDFDQRPRLLHDTTSDLPQLMLSLARLQAEGSTAMYDAVVFSMLQFERQGGRKALVVLTDGDDHESRYGPKYCAELAQELGVPIYVIGLGNLDTFRRTYSKKDLRRITEDTGGRLYFVDSIPELDEAYAQIQAELRSQYSLSFYSDRDLTPEERREIIVRLRSDQLEARTVVGTRPSRSP